MKRVRHNLLILIFIALCGTAVPHYSQVTASFQTGSPVVKIETWGNRLYVAQKNGMIEIFDLFDIDNPALLSSIQLDRTISTLNATSSFLYAAHHEGTLSVVNVSNPREPEVVNLIEAPGIINDIESNGMYLFCATSYSGLTVLDIADLHEPVVITEVATGGFAKSVALSANRLYVAQGQGGMAVVDVSTPAAPVILGNYLSGRYALKISLTPETAFVANGSEGFEIVDVSNDENPLPLFSFSEAPAYFVAPNQASSFVFGNSLMTFDFTNPSNPVQNGQYDFMFNMYDALIRGQRAIVSRVDKGWAILEIDEYRTVLPLSTLPLTDYVYHLNVKDAIVYAAVGTRGIDVIDAFDARNPEIVYSYGSFGVWNLQVEDDRLYMADQRGGVVEMSLINPFVPFYERRFWGYSGNAMSVHVTENEMFIAADYYGMRIVDRSTFAPLNQPDPAAFEFAVTDVLVNGNVAYVIDPFIGILVYDIFDRTLPVFFNVIETSRPTTGRIYKNHLFLACNEFGVRIYDISDPLTPFPTGECTTFFARDVEVVNDNFALVADGSGGLVVIDITDRSQPEIISRHRLEFYHSLESISIENDRAYLTYGNAGLMIVSLADLIPKIAAKPPRWNFYY